MKSLIASIVTWIFLISWTGAQDIEKPVRDILFKITATTRNPDFLQPWNKAKPAEVSGTGFLIEGNRILTNAHVVRYATQIYVQPDQSDQRIGATVESIGYTVDLAVLKLDDESILDGRAALPFDEGLPRVRTDVTVYGYPIGGDQLSVTKGIVSRVEFAGGALRTQIDAAINPGNSGGPAITDGKVVGVAFSGLRQADNIGYLIPISEVRLFLDDVADGKFDGKGNLWDALQTVENPALRDWLGLPKSAGGLMVSSVQTIEKDYPLKPGDVITKIGDTPIDSKGFVKIGDSLNLFFGYLVPSTIADGKVPLTVWRKGEESVVQVPTASNKQTPLLYRPLDGDYPRFAIFGPLTFEAASAELVMGIIQSQGNAALLSAKASPLLKGAAAWRDFEDEEIVVVPAMPFAHKLMKGYSSPVLCTVKEINGIPVKNLKHLVEILRDSEDEFLQFRFADRGTELMTFHRKDFLGATDEILTDNNIRKQFSDDLEEVWKGK
ncbi:MAG: trypsin-like peptidase domain-containing protein [Planctomycetota bacterium]